MVDLNIINGKVFIENEIVDTNLSIDKGKIVNIGKSAKLPQAEKTINADNKLILPGGIDVHSHILDLIFSYREDFVTGTQAAAAGGITTFLEMPLGIEGKSVLESFDMQLEAMKEKSIVDFALIGAAGHSNIDTIKELAARGVVAFKTFMLDAPEELSELKDLSSKNDHYLLEIFAAIRETGLVSSVHAENDAIISNRIQHFIQSKQTNFQAHTDSRPPVSEEEACVRAMMLANDSQTKLNLVHLSSKDSFRYIQLAKQMGWDVTCEITPHHLLLTADDGAKIGSWAKIDPPLRSKEHVVAAWEALNNGTIDFVASDHSPYSHEEKDEGTTGLDTMYPLMIDAVNKKKLSLSRLVEVIAKNPAKRFSLYPRKGTIALNSDADLIIVDMNKEYSLKNEEMFTKQKVTIFDGWNLKGKITQTIVRGIIVYDENQFAVKGGYGQFITPI
ncbi:MAG: dihydroorotase [Candidatus Heimdallarchaeaceae archaeon]